MNDRSRAEVTRPVVVVPVEPGAVRPLPGRREERDDVDVVVDELVGEVDDRPPGAVDAALVVAGAGLVGWAALAGGPAWAAVVGGVLIALGVALPLTWAWRRTAERRLRRRQAKALAGGLPLVVDGEVSLLVAAHERVLAAEPSAPVRAGAHAAVVEVATLLGGEAAADDDSRAFVRERAGALTELADALEAVPAATRARLLEARREAASIGGYDALEVVDSLVREVRGGGGRA